LNSKESYFEGILILSSRRLQGNRIESYAYRLSKHS